MKISSTAILNGKKQTAVTESPTPMKGKIIDRTVVSEQVRSVVETALHFAEAKGRQFDGITITIKY